MSRRYPIVGITAAAALWMYIDRVCVSTVAGDIQRDLGLSKWEKGYALGAFFFTYALLQIPVGALADRWGPRHVLAACILGWSVITAATGLVSGFITLILARLLLGISEAGAYPAAAVLVKRWARPNERGKFSSIVAAGGRVGGAIAPFMTRWLTVALVGASITWWTTSASSTATADHPTRNWRGVFLLYGACGIVLAGLFWLIVRDAPGAVPSPAAPGKTFGDIGGADPAGVWNQLQAFFQRVALLGRSKNMWMFGGTQFCVNVSWAFVVTKLPEYLEQLGVPDEEVGVMQSAVLAIGATGMLIGGAITDGLRRRLGPKLGRSLPIGLALMGCAAACAATAPLAKPWEIVIVLGLMALLVDLGNPAIWSFAQDVGGKNVGAALGWGNMWGNLGAAASPVILTAVQDAAGWSAMFLFCSGSFAVAAVCAFSLDATQPVDPTDPG